MDNRATGGALLTSGDGLMAKKIVGSVPAGHVRVLVVLQVNEDGEVEGCAFGYGSKAEQRRAREDMWHAFDTVDGCVRRYESVVVVPLPKPRSMDIELEEVKD